MSRPPLRVGARTSRLARRQADFVIEGLPPIAGMPAEYVGIASAGDLAPEASFGEIGGTGVFTRELERALLDGQIDAAVHSLKDLATQMPDGLRLGAVLPREDPRDALIVAAALRSAADEEGREGLDAIPDGGTIGTASLRRRAFLLRLRPDLRIESIRGNVPSRLEKLDSGDYDAIVLAVAGLRRLDLESAVFAVMPTAEFPSAPGQGAVAVQVREDDETAAAWIAGLNHVPTEIAVTAERAFLHRIEGGCQVPAGAVAKLDGGTITLTTLVCSPDGTRAVAASAAGAAEEAVGVGRAAAERALQHGAAEILAPLRHTPDGA